MAYATLADVRALDGMADSAAYPDADVTEAIAWATEVIDSHCGPMEPKAVTARVPGVCSAYLFLQGVPGLRSVTSCTIDGEAQDVTGWQVDPDGWVYRPSGTFDGFTVVLTVQAGVHDAAPEQIAWACRTLARQYLLDLKSRTPDRATAIQSEFGTIQMAQAGGPGRPTSLPEVNAVLNRHRAKGVTLG